jgi:hypothetical protein
MTAAIRTLQTADDVRDAAKACDGLAVVAPVSVS